MGMHTYGEHLIETECAPFVVQFAAVDASEAKQLETEAAAEQERDDDEKTDEKPSEPAQALNKASVDKLLSRAQPIKNEEGDEKNFAMRGTYQRVLY